MKKKFCALFLLCSLLITACSKNENSVVEASLFSKYNENFSVYSIYKEGNFDYASAKDENDNFYRFQVDVDRNVVFDDFEAFKKDQLLKEKISQYISGDYLLQVQSNINSTNNCDIFLFTTYKMDIETFSTNICSISEIANKDIYIHTASIDTKENLDDFNKIFNNFLKDYGIITKESEIQISEYFNDYSIIYIEKE